MFDRQQPVIEARAVDISSTDDTFPANMPTRAIYVGGAGNLVVEFAHKPGTQVTYVVGAGSRHVVALSKVIKTGTTATGLIAEF